MRLVEVSLHWQKVVWYHGGRSKRDRPEIETGLDLSGWFNGILFVGDRGMPLADYGRVCYPKISLDFKALSHGLPSLVIIKNGYIAKTGSPTLTLSTQEVLLNITSLDQWLIVCGLQWDVKNLKATNAPEASKYIRKEYRKGWSSSFNLF